MIQVARLEEKNIELIQALKLRQGFPNGSSSRIAAYALENDLPSASVMVASGSLIEIRSIQPVPGKGTFGYDSFVVGCSK